MNVRRMHAVARVLDGLEEHGPVGNQPGFNMDFWFKNPGSGYAAPITAIDRQEFCGTSACVAGWACFLYKDEVSRNGYWRSEGEKILGLTHDESEWLFMGNFNKEVQENAFSAIGHIKPGEAAQAIRDMVDKYQAGLKRRRYDKRNALRRKGAPK